LILSVPHEGYSRNVSCTLYLISVFIRQLNNGDQQNTHLLSLQIIVHKKHHDICQWKSRSWRGTGTKLWHIKRVNLVPILPFLIMGPPTDIFDRSEAFANYTHYKQKCAFTFGSFIDGQKFCLSKGDNCYKKYLYIQSCLKLTNRLFYPALVLSELSSCIDWINFCYIHVLSPWNNWKIAELAISNNPVLTLLYTVTDQDMIFLVPDSCRDNK
jgi:hypothetical protein